MSVLTINGVEPPIAVDSMSVGTPEEIGATGRSVSGALYVDRRVIKSSLGFSLTSMSLEELQAWRSLLLGLGEVWTFDAHIYGSKGGATTGTFTHELESGHYDDDGTIVLAGTTAQLRSAHAQGGAWTVVVDIEIDSEWCRVVVRRDGSKWVDGVRNDAFDTHWLVAAALGVVTIGAASETWRISEVGFYPFNVPDDWMPVWSLLRDAATIGPPRLVCTGDAVDAITNVGHAHGADRLFVGQVSEIQQFGAMRAGVFDPGHFHLSGALLEF